MAYLVILKEGQRAEERGERGGFSIHLLPSRIPIEDDSQGECVGTGVLRRD